MNAFKNYTPPTSPDPNDWAESVQEHCRVLQASGNAHVEVRRVLEAVQAAVGRGELRFLKRTSAEVVQFANKVLEAVQTVDASLTAWHCDNLSPPSERVFVRPDENGRFTYQPMFTL